MIEASDEQEWFVWDDKKQVWLSEVPTLKVEIVGVNELSEDLSEYREPRTKCGCNWHR